MSLKQDREVDAVDISFFMNETATRGVIVSTSTATAGSGIAMDNPGSVATVSASSSGALPLGMLLNDVVSVDQTRTPINWHQDQVQLGNKVTIMTKGWAVTNNVSGTPRAGNLAMLISSGVITTQTAAATWNQVANPRVGRFRSGVDQNGYAKVYVDL